MAEQESWKDIAQRVAMFGQAGKKRDRAQAMLERTLTNFPVCKPGQAHLAVFCEAMAEKLNFAWLAKFNDTVKAQQMGLDDWRAQAYERISMSAEKVEASQKTTLEKLGATV